MAPRSNLMSVAGLAAILTQAACSPTASIADDSWRMAQQGGSPSSTIGGATANNGGAISPGSGGTSSIPIPTSTPMSTKCGNGQQDGEEQCDDGNKQGGDGCTALCQIETEWNCPQWGRPCQSSVVCGDAQLASTERCDDGNTNDGDGCSRDCMHVENGWQCRKPGSRCVPVCGDGVVTGTEKCDDGNTKSDDGCSNVCLLEVGYDCPTPGAACKATQCGNGIKEGDESCDAGDKNGLFFGDGTGCSKTCTKEPNCRSGGVTQACSTACGDGNRDSDEACDDANTFDGDGCSSKCQTEAGFTCVDNQTKDTQPCSGGGGQCLVLPITFRDFDSQKESTGHPDFFYMGSGSTVCVPNASGRTQGTSGSCPGNDSTALCPGLVRDTLDGTTGKPVASSSLTCPCQFTDWDKTGILNNVTVGTKITCQSGGSGDITSISVPNVQVIKSVDSFREWYSDSGKSKTLIDKLELAQVGNSNQYQFSSSNGRSVYDDIHDIFLKNTGGTTGGSAVTSLGSGFFPDVMEKDGRPKICNLWPYWRDWGSSCTGTQWDARANSGSGSNVDKVTGLVRNFYFTSEVRYLFRYVGGETLQFFGDDDVWVFLNGKLVLDLGAPHERLQGTVTLTSTGSSAKTEAQDVVSGNFVTVGKPQNTNNLGLEPGKTYEIAVFHADRHPRESNYQLTVSGFSTTRTSCTPHCGDAVATAGEECDDGDNNKDASQAYNACTKQCTYGPYCGDNEVNGNGAEECDNGVKNGAPYGTVGGCTTDCRKVHFCGDRIIDSAAEEECDAGPDGSRECTNQCKINWSNIIL